MSRREVRVLSDPKQYPARVISLKSTRSRRQSNRAHATRACHDECKMKTESRTSALRKFGVMLNFAPTMPRAPLPPGQLLQQRKHQHKSSTDISHQPANPRTWLPNKTQLHIAKAKEAQVRKMFDQSTAVRELMCGRDPRFDLRAMKNYRHQSGSVSQLGAQSAEFVTSRTLGAQPPSDTKKQTMYFVAWRSLSYRA